MVNNNNKELLEISTMDDVFHGFSPQSPLEDLQTSLETALHPEVSLDWDPGLEDGEMEACLRTFTNADRFENVGLPVDVGETRGLGEDSGPRSRGADERKSGRRCHPVKEMPRGRKRIARPASHDEEDEEDEDEDEKEEEEEELQKNRKNAIAARLNRQRKKRYVEGLEVQVGDLEHEKQQLQNECEQLEGRVKQLEGEVVYLRSVLSNDSALAGLLNLVTCAGRTGLLKTHTSPRTNSLVAEHDYAGCGENKMSFRAECVDTVLERAERNGLRYPLTESETPKNGVSVGGLCLHVDRGLVSVELCAVCAQQAADLRKAKSIQE